MTGEGPRRRAARAINEDMGYYHVGLAAWERTEGGLEFLSDGLDAYDAGTGTGG